MIFKKTTGGTKGRNSPHADWRNPFLGAEQARRDRQRRDQIELLVGSIIVGLATILAFSYTLDGLGALIFAAG